MALHHQHSRVLGGQQSAQGRRHGLGIGVRIGEPASPQRSRWNLAKVQAVEIERGMLACEDQERRKAARLQGVNHRGKLDGFRPGTDDDPDTRREHGRSP
jgi:hypothetical protein